MITHPVSRYLIQFGIEEDAKQPVVYEDVLQTLPAEPEHRQEDHEALLRAARDDARAEGHSQGLAAAQAYFDAIIADQKADYDRRLAEERNRWIAEESLALMHGFKTALLQFSDEFADSVSSILRPFLIESLRRQMIDELATDVKSLLANNENPAILISGAADLLTILKDRLASESVAIEYRVSDSIDVQIVAHHTVIESQLRAWIDRFEPSKE